MLQRFILKQTSVVTALLGLSACGTPPAMYVPAPTERTAVVKLAGEQKGVRICRSGQPLYVTSTTSGNIRSVVIPADERITLISLIAIEGYNVRSTCSPAISLIVKTGTSVVLNADVQENGCYFEAVREDASSPSGLAVEPSVGPPSC